MNNKPDQPEEEEEKEELEESSLLSHLIELRSRLMKAAGTILVFFVPLAFYAETVYRVVAAPVMRQLPENWSMIATSPASPFLTPFKTAFFAAVFAAMPIIIYQAWAFVAPGLYKREKKVALPLVLTSIFLFYAGAAFAYFVVFPLIFGFFVAVTPQDVAMMPDIGEYLSFVLVLFFVFGIAFEVPIAILMLVGAGIVSPKSLGRKRPYILLGAFTAGMLLTPPDMISQTLLAIPMYLLYEIGILMARIMIKKREAAAD
ncbi:MAG: twin-arginine translocase subunit TatC [Gammaproteobacteria bacterium]|nr:twin-arginine translocase subunit TatC [Gammaproteobacteria bacterium]